MQEFVDGAALPPEPDKKRAKQNREWLLGLLVVIAPRLISGALWLISKTVRIEYVNADGLFSRWARGEQVILAFWHNRV
ncbi:MAG: hypothetical protein ACRDL7_03765, partial [Gaiellaceae bacterium]